jgi:hypothetical protein
MLRAPLQCRDAARGVVDVPTRVDLNLTKD